MYYDDYIILDNAEAITFSGGEQHVNMPYLVYGKKVIIDIPITSSAKLMDVLLLNEICRRNGAVRVELKLLYIPYARQDRATTHSSPRSLKVFSEILNAAKFDAVYVMDPHSMVAENLINNMVQWDVLPYINQFITEQCSSGIAGVLVSPDAGALKKVEKYAANLRGFVKDILVANKTRNPATGEITGMKLASQSGKISDYSEYTLVVIDDLLDGGRTFTELAKILPKCKSLNLFITHGIFSKGVDVIFDAGYNKIGCTDSFPSDAVLNDKRLIVYKVNSY